MDVYVFIGRVTGSVDDFVKNARTIVGTVGWVGKVACPDYVVFAMLKGVNAAQRQTAIQALGDLGGQNLHAANAGGASPYGIKSIRRPAEGFVRLYCAAGQATNVRNAARALDPAGNITAETVVHDGSNGDDYDVLVNISGDTNDAVGFWIPRVIGLPGADRKPGKSGTYQPPPLA